MKKKATIEDEFMNYNGNDLISEEGRKNILRDILNTIIQLLAILVLLGFLILGLIVGYEYINNEDSEESASLPSSITKMDTNSTKQSKERMYTEKEMYEIVELMMSKMQVELKNKTNEKVIVKENTNKKEQNIEKEFVNLLESFEDEYKASVTTNDQKTVETKIDKSSKQESVKKELDNHPNSDKVVSQRDLATNEKEGKKSKQNKGVIKAKIKNVAKKKNTMRIIVVQSGDTLSMIAKRAYGSALAYDKIFKSNPTLGNNPHHIYVGQRLRVPLD